ncbi:hypothetical protein JOB18_026776 [Solea senegalensis]|uniref:Uncharacterized protein n=1 Tax=Solea senegalensis TaxID=28829 RepID=A0AAV6QGH5_SOLSE|nr:hypothetical protein JOB18_026776 [Solea senegalensis]
MSSVAVGHNKRIWTSTSRSRLHSFVGSVADVFWEHFRCVHSDSGQSADAWRPLVVSMRW